MVSATSSANHNRPKPPTKPEAMNVEIRGLCPSACTLVLAHVPKERLCFSQTAVLAFHLARFPNGEPTIEGSLAMFNAYPRDIRMWLQEKGGVEKMSFESFWLLFSTRVVADGLSAM